MPESTLFSIIIPVYNGDRYLNDSVSSVLSQTYSGVEVIVVDDGSADRTGEMALCLQRQDARVKYFKIDNSGVSYARKAGITKAGGQWISFLDVDDRLPANACETYLGYIGSNPEIIATGESGPMTLSEYKSGLMRRTAHPELWGKLFRTDFIRAHYPDLDRKIKIGEDQTINLVLANRASNLITIPEQLYCYNLSNPESVTRTFRRTNDYEIMFERLFNTVVRPEFDPEDHALRYAEYKMKIEGCKMVVLDGNRFDVTSEEWQEIVKYYNSHPAELAASEKLIITLSRFQWLYALIMKVRLVFNHS